MKLQSAMRALEYGSEEKALHEAQRILRKAVHAVSPVHPVNTIPSAACTLAVKAENDVKGHTHPSVQGARDLPTVLALINVRIEEALEPGSMDPDKTMAARALLGYK